MRTLVFPPTGVHGFGRTRTVAVVARPLNTMDALGVLHHLAAQSIQVGYAVDARQVVHLSPLAPLTTAQEVQALREFAAVTDARLAWHGKESA